MGSAGCKSGAKAQAVVVNSGIANACTGAEGFGYCKDTADAAAKALNISQTVFSSVLPELSENRFRSTN